MDLQEIITLHYGLHPQHMMKLSAHSYYFTDGGNSFVLKESSLSEKQLFMWENIFRFAHEENMSSILPVFLTKEGKLYHSVADRIYYLSPFIKSSSIPMKKFYEKLGHIHQHSRTERTIAFKNIKQSFKKYHQQCKENKSILRAYVELFEQEHYMSPLALQVCTHYRDLQRILQKLTEKIYELISSEEEMVWSTSLCHGSLRFSHVLYDQQIYFIHWEQASIENATTDLLHFFKAETGHYDAPIDDFISLFDHYLQANELSSTEILILSIYLLDPHPYLQEIYFYLHNRKQSSMLQQTKKLQHLYRQLIFAAKFVEALEMSLDPLDDDEFEEDV